jgi:phytanoyl-CoA hydroxylase
MSMLVRPAEEFEIEGALREYDARGFASLGRVVSDEGLTRLRRQADAIMLGEVTHEGLFFQHDSKTGRYEHLTLGDGWIGPSHDYRKI